MKPSVRQPSAPAQARRNVFASPATRLGRWSAALGAAFVLMFILNLVVFASRAWDAPARHVVRLYYGMIMLLSGLAGGITGLIALLRRGERSWLVLLSVLLGLFVLAIVVGEIIGGH